MESGTLAPKKRGGYRLSRLAEHDSSLQAWIKDDRSITLSEIRGRLREQLGIEVGTTALWHRLNRLNLTFKKTLRAAEQDRPDIEAARQAWKQNREHWDYRHLVFLDETGLNTKMSRLYGRSLRGERCLSSIPHGHWKTATFIAALRHDSLGAYG